MRIPLELRVPRRPSKLPLADGSARLNVPLQAVSVRQELPIREVLPAHLEIVVPELVGDVAGVVGRLGDSGLEGELPAVGAGVDAAELVVVRVEFRVVALAAVDHGVGEGVETVGRGGDGQRLVL